MTPRARIVALAALLILAVAVAACGAPARSPQVVEKVIPAGQSAPPAQPQPGSADATANTTGATVITGQNGLQQTNVPPAGPRKIIKDGRIQLLVEAVDAAIDSITRLAADLGGYVLSSETRAGDLSRSGTVVISVPADDFEEAMRQLRGLAKKVDGENATGKDVTEEYVDLQAQLTNLEATQLRVRAFLDQAQTVEEALKVSQELSRIEGEIARVKGRMTYLSQRAAFSTITIDLYESNITPTPEPVTWQPGETFKDARHTLTVTLRGLGDLAVWGGVFCLPLALIALIVLLPLILWRRRAVARRREQAVAAAALVPPPAPRAGDAEEPKR